MKRSSTSRGETRKWKGKLMASISTPTRLEISMKRNREGQWDADTSLEHFVEVGVFWVVILLVVATKPALRGEVRREHLDLVQRFGRPVDTGSDRLGEPIDLGQDSRNIDLLVDMRAREHEPLCQRGRGAARTGARAGSADARSRLERGRGTQQAPGPTWGAPPRGVYSPVSLPLTACHTRSGCSGTHSTHGGFDPRLKGLSLYAWLSS